MHITIIHLRFIFNCNNNFVRDIIEMRAIFRALCINLVSFCMTELRAPFMNYEIAYATNRRYDRVYRRIYPASLGAGLDIRPYFVDAGSGWPESI